MNQLTDIVSNLFEAAAKTGSIQKRIEYAVKNRHPVSFYYQGPDAKSGRRIKAEPVATGLSAKGNYSVRAFVQPPSESKKGFAETNWRTFNTKGISSLEVYEDETFDTKRPGYKEGNDGSFNPTYVTSDWGLPTKSVERPQQTKTPTELPQPKVDDKPTPSPTPEVQRDVEVFNDLKNKINVVNNQKTLSPEEIKLAIDDLYKKKMEDWKTSQSKVDANMDPGEGTRRRFERESESEIYNLMKKENIVQTQEVDTLQESINRIKTLISF